MVKIEKETAVPRQVKCKRCNVQLSMGALKMHDLKTTDWMAMHENDVKLTVL